MTNSDVTSKVCEGFRLVPPENAPTQVRELMSRCWKQG